jgi:ribosomal protein S13
MKKSILYGLFAVIVIALFLWANFVYQPFGEKDPLLILEKQAETLNAQGDLAVIGIGESRSVQIARQKAELDARVKLAQMQGDFVEKLQRAFEKETGGSDPVLSAQFKELKKALSGTVKGSHSIEELSTEQDGMPSTHILMSVAANDFRTHLNSELQKYPELLESLKKSQAGKGLLEEGLN